MPFHANVSDARVGWRAYAAALCVAAGLVVPALADEILIQHPDPAGARFDGRMVLTDGVLAVMDGDSKVYRFDSATGALLSPVPITDPAPGNCSIVNVCSSAGVPVACCTGPGTGTCCAQNFGQSFGALGSHILIGNPFTYDGNGGSGVVYDFDAHTGALNRVFISPSGGLDQRFGAGIAAANGIIAIGSAQAGDFGIPNVRPGRVYLYDAATGALLRTLHDPSPFGMVESNNFGSSLPTDSWMAFAGPYLAVAALTGIDGGPEAGQVYVFETATGALARRLAPPAPFNAPSTAFGASGLSAVGDHLRVKATYWNPVDQAKAVYRFSASTGQLRKAIRQPSYSDIMGGPFGVLEVWNRSGTGVDLVDPVSGSRVLQLSVFAAGYSVAEGGTLAVMSQELGTHGVRGVVHLFRSIFACGNAAVEAGERCDDGNTADGDGCDHDCTPTACGNGIVTAGEVCDDGNTASGDGCAPDCAADCGDGVQAGAEQCDDGNRTDGDGCDHDCSSTACGNGILTAGEECDDGNLDDADGCSSACEPEALDLTGTWQITTSYIGVTATRFVTLTSDGSSVELDLSDICGTRAFGNGVIPVSSCEIVGALPSGTSLGADFQLPDAGSYIEDVALSQPVFSTVRLVERVRMAGTVEGQDGRAERIVGRIYVKTDQYDANGNLVGVGSEGVLPMVMRRADAPTGLFVTVEPADGASVQLTAVEGAGTAGAIPLTNPTGTLPPGFRVVSNSLINDTGLTDMLTTSSPVGAILTCLTYPDVDDDGVVDFTNPPLLETNVRILHSENGAFADRTFSRDTVANRVCAQTLSLSQFIVGSLAPTPTTSTTSSTSTTTTTSTSSTTTTLPTCTVQPSAGCRAAAPRGSAVTLKASTDATRNLLAWKWKGTSTVADFGNPVGATSLLLCAYANESLALSARVPAGGTCGSKPCWKTAGTKGFGYRNPARLPAGILTAKLKAAPSGSASIAMKGKGALLAMPPLPLGTPVVVQLQGSNGTCWTATFTTPKANAPTSFRARSD